MMDSCREAKVVETETKKSIWCKLVKKWSDGDARVGKVLAKVVRLAGRNVEEWPINNFFMSSSDGVESFVARNFREVLRLTPVDAWEDIIALGPADMPLPSIESKNIRMLPKLWRRLSAEGASAAKESAEIELGEFLCSLLGWSLTKRRQLSNLSFLEARVESTRIRLPHVVAIRFAYRDDGANLAQVAVDVEQVSARIDTSRQSSSGIVINIAMLDYKEAKELQRSLAREHTILLLGEKELRAILLSKRYIDKFEQIAVDYLGLLRMNPYVWDKPVDRPEMFFGRELEVDEVFGSPADDFIIVGTRRIGKSSLLRHLDRLASANKNERTPIYVDCSVFESAHDIILRLTEVINSRRMKRIGLSTFGQMVRTTQSVHAKGHRFLLLFDEVDRLVASAEASSNWRFFEVMRDLSNSGLVQCVFSGHKVLVTAWRNQQSPLFNFVRPLYLSTLSTEGARKLIQIPMRSMNLEYERPAIVDEIISETGGHPSFIQALCGLIVRAVDRKAETRRGEIDQLVVQEARSSREYRELVLKTFSIEGNLSKLDQLIVLELTKAGQNSFEIQHLLDALLVRCSGLGFDPSSIVTADSIAHSLVDLEIAGVVIKRGTSRNNRDGGEYSWTVSAFPEFLGRSLPVDRKIEELVRDLKNGQ
jgi:hypothetical protein